MRNVIRLNDPTTHGGMVVAAASTTTVMGIAVARKGDRCFCPIQGHQNCVIAEGDPKVTSGVSSAAFDQGIDMPGAYRAKGRQREAGDPYADDREIKKEHLAYADGATTDAAQGDTNSEAALKYERHAMLRMQAKREGLYKNNVRVTEEDNPSTASAKYTDWRNEKIRTSFAKSIDTHATDHSTIMTNPVHAQRALAYDVAIGVCRVKEADMHELRILADWRIAPDKLLDTTSVERYKYFLFGLVFKKSPLDWVADPSCPGRMPEKITNKR